MSKRCPYSGVVMNFQALIPFYHFNLLEISPYSDLDNALRLHFVQIVIRQESLILNCGIQFRSSLLKRIYLSQIWLFKVMNQKLISYTMYLICMNMPRRIHKANLPIPKEKTRRYNSLASCD